MLWKVPFDFVPKTEIQLNKNTQISLKIKLIVEKIVIIRNSIKSRKIMCDLI